MDATECHIAEFVSRYLVLTEEVMAKIARTSDIRWPVRYDHCFQRIVLNTVWNGVWYEHLARPAYKHLSSEQPVRAGQLCKDIMAIRADLRVLYSQSLNWRSK
ncbi:MAG: hypothetical protein ACJAVT_000255 [Yoonia sp.]